MCANNPVMSSGLHLSILGLALCVIHAGCVPPAAEELAVVRTREEMKYRERVAVQKEILRQKVLDCAKGWVWHLIAQGHRKEARAALSKYRALYPGNRGLIRLWLRSLIPV